MFLRFLIRFFTLPSDNFQSPQQIAYKLPPARAHPARTSSQLLSDFQYLPNLKVLQVVDGDTVVLCKDGRPTYVRLDSIDCPEDGQYWGDKATYALIGMIGGKNVRFEEHGMDVHGRVLATLYVWHEGKQDWLNVNERMVTLGHAWVARRYYNHLPMDRKTKFNRLEKWAKSKKIGLWHDPNPVPPWKWRMGEDWF